MMNIREAIDKWLRSVHEARGAALEEVHERALWSGEHGVLVVFDLTSVFADVSPVVPYGIRWEYGEPGKPMTVKRLELSVDDQAGAVRDEVIRVRALDPL